MKKTAILIFLLFSLRVVSAFWVWHIDVENHIDWGIRFFEYGAGGFYSPEANVWNYTWPNQPPGSTLLFALIRKLFEGIFALFWTVNINIPAFPSGIITFFDKRLYAALLQLPAILADFGIAYLLYKIASDIKNRRAGKIAAVVFLINPVIWYNSAVWGQTDATVNFFGLLAFYLLFKNKPTLSVAAFAASLFIKISLAIFLPIYLILLVKKYDLRKLALFVLPSVIAILLLTLPFSLSSGRNPLSWLIHLYTDKVLAQQQHVITANAFNLWGALTGLHLQPNSQMLGPLTFEAWGNILLATALAPILYLVIKKQDEKIVYWALAMTAFSVFMLLTNMHERYLFPMFPYFTILAILYRRLIPVYVAVSAVNLVNLYNLWWVPRVSFFEEVLIANDFLIPRALSFAVLGMYIYMYREFLTRFR